LDISLPRFDSREALECSGPIFAVILLGTCFILAGAKHLFLVRIFGSIVGKNPPLDFARLWPTGFRTIFFRSPGEGTDFDRDIDFDREGKEFVWP
jgi:hypothetical protein